MKIRRLVRVRVISQRILNTTPARDIMVTLQLCRLSTFFLFRFLCFSPNNSFKACVLLFSLISESQNASKTSDVCKSLPHTENPVPTNRWPIRLLSLIFVTQGVFTSLLGLINSLVMLLILPEVIDSSGACCLLVYLDPGLSLLAVITLIATSAPQVTLCVFMSC